MQALSSMTFDVTHKHFGEKAFFKKAGYKKHIRGYIKKDDDGRFHIVHVGLGYWSIHYDVNTGGGRHMTMPSEYKLPEEFKRIVKKIGYLPNIRRKNAKKTTINKGKRKA